MSKYWQSFHGNAATLHRPEAEKQGKGWGSEWHQAVLSPRLLFLANSCLSNMYIAHTCELLDVQVCYVCFQRRRNLARENAWQLGGHPTRPKWTDQSSYFLSQLSTSVYYILLKVQCGIISQTLSLKQIKHIKLVKHAETWWNRNRICSNPTWKGRYETRREHQISSCTQEDCEWCSQTNGGNSTAGIEQHANLKRWELTPASQLHISRKNVETWYEFHLGFLFQA